MQLELAIIILNYRTARMTVDCLRSLASQIDGATRVIIVDNDSQDGSAERIREEIAAASWTWATVLCSPKNGGFAAGNNMGIRSVSAKAYMLLNSDTLVQPGVVAGLRDALAARSDAGIVGPGMLDSRGCPDQSCFRDLSPIGELLRGAETGLVNRLLNRFHPVIRKNLASTEPMDVDWLGFACVVIRREVFERIGLLDENYFMYFEDVDFCRRARQAGFAIVHWPKAKIVHLLGGSSQVTSAGKQQRRAPRYFYEARSRYFAKFYGRVGLWSANCLWHVGDSAEMLRSVVERRPPKHRVREPFDLWVNSMTPLRSLANVSSDSTLNASPAGSKSYGQALPMAMDPYQHGAPLPLGDSNQNPREISLWDLLVEDFRTHDSSFTQPGFWAVLVHRFGNARMSVRPKILRAPLSLAYHVMFYSVDWFWGIDLPYVTRLGRRVRIWHHGGIILGARSIGDDVHIRQNVTMGLAHRGDLTQKPIIGSRVDIGAGACVLGGITVADDCTIGANTVVLRDLLPGSTVLGIPARPVNLHPAAPATPVSPRVMKAP